MAMTICLSADPMRSRLQGKVKHNEGILLERKQVENQGAWESHWPTRQVSSSRGSREEESVLEHPTASGRFSRATAESTSQTFRRVQDLPRWSALVSLPISVTGWEPPNGGVPLAGLQGRSSESSSWNSWSTTLPGVGDLPETFSWLLHEHSHGAEIMPLICRAGEYILST